VDEMLEAFVLVETRLGMADEVAHRFEQVEEIIHADVVTGCYDILVRVRAWSLESLGEVVAAMKSVDGVTRALACPVEHPAPAAHRGWPPIHAAV